MFIKEGGNVFKDADGAILTTRINQTDVKPTVQWLEQLTGLPLMDNMLGSTGQKPNNTKMNAGKLTFSMQSSSNLGFGGSWNDVLWMSSYTGGDVKKSVALVSSKYDNTSLC